MDYKLELTQSIKRLGRNYVLNELGYSSPTDKQIERLESLLTSPFLNLNESNFDFKYSNIEYIKTITKICGLDIKTAESYINETLKKVSARKTSFKPYIFVETGFKRTSQPIFVLAAIESQRYLDLPEYFDIKPSLEQLAVVHQVIDEHQEETKGSLQIWGEVISYFFVYDKNCALEISPKGKVIKIHTDYSPSSHARITHKGKELKLAY